MLINYYEVAIHASNLAPLTYESEAEISSGVQVTVPLRGRIKNATVLRAVEEPPFKTAAIDEILATRLSEEALSLATFISAYYISALGIALALFTPRSSENIKQCASEPLEPLSITLSDTQNQALDFLHQHPKALLFGDTGAGKTEIYIHRMHEVLEAGKTILFLLPEISLTPQMQTRLEKHFGSRLALWHSKLSKKKRTQTLESIHTGSVKILAGPRSILFLPLEKLGLIIVDEEHDDSYKSGQAPRYHARDLAILMATKQNIPLILGSATPSLSSYTKFPYYRLKGGYYDSKRAIHFEASYESMTPTIYQALQASYDADKQSLLFLPTRANFKYLICQSCGENLTCPFCSVGMSVHTNKGIVRCHYCNYSEAIPKVCPSCKHPDLSSNRLGTAEVAKQLQAHFNTQNIIAFDRDHITTDKALKKVLNAFNTHQIDTLVGTQMLSKGHDYHDIALAVILGIDHILSQSDYRAREKALSLLIQIMGRAGRKSDAHIIVQSFHEDFFRLYLDDYEKFLKDEIGFREGFYPPFTKLARILFAHKSYTQAEDAMHAMVNALKSYPEVEIMGYGKANIEKIANKFRYTILLRSRSSKPLLSAIKATLHPLAQVDIDPIDFA